MGDVAKKVGVVAKKVGVVAKNWELSYLELPLFGVVAKKVGVVALELSFRVVGRSPEWP